MAHPLLSSEWTDVANMSDNETVSDGEHHGDTPTSTSNEDIDLDLELSVDVTGNGDETQPFNVTKSVNDESDSDENNDDDDENNDDDEDDEDDAAAAAGLSTSEREILTLLAVDKVG